MPFGNIAKDVERAAAPKKRIKRPEPAGPYRSQSSVPSIRRKATPAEHRTSSIPARSNSSRTSSDFLSAPSLPRAIERKSTQLKRETAHKVAKLRALDVLKSKAIETLREAKPPPEPHTIYQRARYAGIKPPASEAKAFPKAYERAKIASLKENLGEPEDITHAIEAASLATGAGALAKLAVTGGEEAAAGLTAKEATNLGSKALSAAQSGTERVAKATASRVKAEGKALKGLPAKKVAKVKQTPARVRSAPKRARRAVATKQGRRAAAQSTARSARRHPVRSTYGAAAVSPVPLPGELDKRARAFAEGSGRALLHHPAETLETTGRSLAGAITGPAALLGAAASSVKHGTPAPLVNTAEEQVKGVGHIVGQAFSGDTKKAEEAARKEGSLALATPLPAVTRLKAWERGRGALRKGANEARRSVAARSDTLNARVRHAPAGAEPRVTGLSERKGLRKKVALTKQRIDNPHRIAREKHEASIAHAAADLPPEAHKAMQVLAEYGARNPRHISDLRQLGPGDKQLHEALDYLEKHPEAFNHKATLKVLEAVRKAGEGAPAAVVGKGERARLLPQGDLFGVHRPEEMISTKAEKLSGATTRQGAWDKLAAADKRVTELRKEGRKLFNQAEVLKGIDRQRVLDQGRARFAEVRAQFKQNKALYAELEKFTFPERNIDQSKLKPYNDEMRNRYKDRVETERAARGYAPAIWTHHAPLEQRGAGLEGTPGQRPATVEHMRTGKTALEDNLDRSLEGLVRGVAHVPRQREAARQFMRAIPETFKTPFKLDGKERFIVRDSKDWKAITTRKTKDNPDGGQVDPKSYGRLALREFNSALKDPYMGESERTSTILRILDEAEAGKVKGHEPSLLVPREAIVEARSQVSAQHHEITKVANAVNRGAVRTLLGTNPAWFISQIPAVAIPAVLTNPGLLNPLHVASIYKDVLKQRKNNPEAALAMEGAAGAQSISSAALRTPLDMQEALTPVEWARGAKALTRGKTARNALSFAKLEMLGKANAKFEGELRQVVYAMKADKQFRAWHKAVTGMFDTQAELSKRFRNQPREKLWEYLQNDPAGKRARVKLEDHMDSAMGNWTAFTRYERAFAPLAIFYGFLRYSLRWSAWTFPRDHPIMATAAYMLGQANANQIEKLTGEGLHEEGLQKTNAPAKPSNPLAFAMPVYEGPSGKKAVLPGGTRISPGQSSLTQALGSANPAAVLSSANPLISSGITAFTGVEPFSGEKTTKPKGWAALEQITSLPFPLRARLPFMGNQSLGEKGLQALGAPERGPASKAYEKLDPGKTIRSGIWPFLPQSATNFKKTEALSKSFDLKYGKGKIPGPFDNALVSELLYGNNGKPKPELLPKVLAAIHASEEGSAKVKEAESPFYPGGGSNDFTKLQSQLLEAVEDAWKTGPSGTKKKVRRGGIGGSSGGIGGPSGASIGGPGGGGIGGPNGVSIGGP